MLGDKTKLTGLSSDDKIGKISLAGLVWSVPCLNTCPVLTGKTQTPFLEVKSLGVIVWIYLNIEGGLSADGDIAVAHLNPAKISLGIKRNSNGNFEQINSLERIASSGRLIEIPKFKGAADFQAKIGLTTELDFFAAGVRIVSAGLDAPFAHISGLEL